MRAKEGLSIVHLDICGSLKSPSYIGKGEKLDHATLKEKT